MQLTTRGGKKRVKRTKTDENQIASVLGIAELLALNFPDHELGKLGDQLASAIRAVNVALAAHEAPDK